MRYIVGTLLFVILGLAGAWTAPPSPCGTSIAEEERLRDALEQIAILDEADGHTLTWETASQAVGIATHALGDKHPSQIFEEREARRRATGHIK